MHQSQFEQSLQIGITAENLVHDYLTARFQYVQDCRKQRHEYMNGPSLTGTSGRLILPDFVVYDAVAGNWAIDSKFKSSVYPIQGCHCFTVDYDKLQDYMNAAAVMRLDGVQLLFVYNGGIYSYLSTDMAGTHAFNNKYGSIAALYEYDSRRRIA